MIEEIEFSKTYEYDVDVYHDTLGELGKAKLKFGGNNIPYVHFKDVLSNRVAHQRQTYDVLKARTEEGGCFTLFQCKFWGFVLHADFVVDGDVEDKFNAIEIRYSDISEWFCRWQDLKGEIGEGLKWVNKPDHISAIVQTKDEHFSLKTEMAGHAKKKGEDYIIHEHVAFTFEKISRDFCIKDARSRASELAHLLSILVACPISIISVQVMGSGRRPYSVYFGAIKRLENVKDDFPDRCFASKRDLDGKWQTIVGRYYESAYRKVSWSRLAGMQRYEGFWDYKALGYVSLLDKYVSQASIGHVKPTFPAKKKLRRLSAAVKRAKYTLSNEQHDEVMNLVEKQFSGKRELHFSEQFDYVVGQSDPDIIRVINISKKDFMFIKEVRDAIAHGDATDFLGSDLTRVLSIIDKIALLMTYFAFMDFGLTADDFKKCLRGNFNRLNMNLGLDKVHLARITKTAVFYNVSKRELDRVAKLKDSKTCVCLERGPRGAITYSKKYTELSEQWFRAGFKKTGLETFDDIFGVKKEQVISTGATYLEHGKQSLSLHHAYVISVT